MRHPFSAGKLNFHSDEMEWMKKSKNVVCASLLDVKQRERLIAVWWIQFNLTSLVTFLFSLHRCSNIFTTNLCVMKMNSISIQSIFSLSFFFSNSASLFHFTLHGVFFSPLKIHINHSIITINKSISFRLPIFFLYAVHNNIIIIKLRSLGGVKYIGNRHTQTFGW